MKAPRRRPEPVQVIKQRRDTTLRALVDGVPYIRFLGIQFERRGDELTGILPFDEKLIGNPLLPAIHGGVTAAFLEVTAIITLSWSYLWEDVESGAIDAAGLAETGLPRLPKTIDMRARASTASAAATPACTSRPGRTIATGSSRRRPGIS